MKQKSIALCLAAAMALSLLAGCGPKESGSASGSVSGSVSQPDVSTPDTSAPDASAPDQSVTPEPQAQVSLALDKSDFTLFSAGSTAAIQATLTGSQETVVWSSEDESIAAVDEKGVVTAVAPGSVTITASAGELTAKCIVRCRFETEKPQEKPQEKPAADLAAFYADITGKYEFGFLEPANAELAESLYPGITALETKQSLINVCMMSMNNGEFVLLELADSGDVNAAKAILQTRVDGMIDGGAWYPESTRIWTECSRVVSSGNYVMLIVHEENAAIVDAFNALFQ